MTTLCQPYYQCNFRAQFSTYMNNWINIENELTIHGHRDQDVGTDIATEHFLEQTHQILWNTVNRYYHVCSYQRSLHYDGVIMARLRLKSPAPRLFTQPFIRAQIKVNIKAPLAFVWGIPRTNGQWRGKCFHLKTSSYMCQSKHLVTLSIL